MRRFRYILAAAVIAATGAVGLAPAQAATRAAPAVATASHDSGIVQVHKRHRHARHHLRHRRHVVRPYYYHPYAYYYRPHRHRYHYGHPGVTFGFSFGGGHPYYHHRRHHRW